MSAQLREEGFSLDKRRGTKIVLVGPPTLTRVRRDDSPLVVIGNEGNWQDRLAREVAKCNRGQFAPCGCPRNNCQCGLPNAPPQPANLPPQGQPIDWDNIDCDTPGWVAFTVNNNALVGANGTGSVSFTPQAPFKLARLGLTAAQAADFTGIQVSVADVNNILPAPVDGTYFSFADNQDGDGRIRCPIAQAGTLINIAFISTAGVGAAAARFTFQGVYQRSAWV